MSFNQNLPLNFGLDFSSIHLSSNPPFLCSTLGFLHGTVVTPTPDLEELVLRFSWPLPLLSSPVCLNLLGPKLRLMQLSQVTSHTKGGAKEAVMASFQTKLSKSLLLNY